NRRAPGSGTRYPRRLAAAGPGDAGIERTSLEGDRKSRAPDHRTRQRRAVTQPDRDPGLRFPRGRGRRGRKGTPDAEPRGPARNAREVSNPGGTFQREAERSAQVPGHALADLEDRTGTAARDARRSLFDSRVLFVPERR